MLTKISLYLITGYKKTLSPYLGGECRFYPSCSEYTRMSLIKYGFRTGITKALWRLMRCNPFNKGGIDLP